MTGAKTFSTMVKILRFPIFADGDFGEMKMVETLSKSRRVGMQGKTIRAICEMLGVH